ncbi:MAG: glycosyltransferase family 2 protein [Burkholderiales bacterium]|nr:glycosyltransferase family 2 protein [Bacteroidia bacterium]
MFNSVLSNTHPLISVCIPAYNCGQYIAATINSLIIQSYENLEIIVVNDGSLDDTLDVLKNIKENRLKFVTQKNEGASAARNAALRLSSGSFIKFMDGDDLIGPDSLQSQLQAIIDKPGCIASAKWGRFYAADASDFKLSPENVWRDMTGIDWLIESLFETGANMMQPGIFLIPRQLIESAGPWNESLSLIDDFEYMVRVITNSNMVLFCEDAILMYRSGLQNSLSGKDSAIHMASASKSLQLGVAQILTTRNDSITRQACANTYKRWAYQFYPMHKTLYLELEKEVEKLGGSKTVIISSKLFYLLTKFVGWKLAKRIKILITGNQ